MKTITVSFNAPIKDYEIQALRGAILSLLKPDVPLIFHNHKEDGLAYSYPLVQYKSISGNAAVVLVEEGCRYVAELLSVAGKDVIISGRRITLEIAGFKAVETEVQVGNNTLTYFIGNWCPLNSENTAIFKKIDSDEERLGFLNKILIGNILSMGKGTDIFLEGTVHCSICSIKNEKSTPYKGVDFITMDIEFKTNVNLPDSISLGKHSSIGFGVLERR